MVITFTIQNTGTVNNVEQRIVLMANTHQVTIGHLSFTSPGQISYTGGGTERSYTISGVLAHTNSATGLNLDENNI